MLTLAVVTSCGKHVVILAVELRGICQEVGLNTKFKYDVGQFEDCGYSMEAIYSSSDQDYDSGDKRGTKRWLWRQTNNCAGDFYLGYAQLN